MDKKIMDTNAKSYPDSITLEMFVSPLPPSTPTPKKNKWKQKKAHSREIIIKLFKRTSENYTNYSTL